jgi:hypothetical protein
MKPTTLYKSIAANDPYFVDLDKLNRMVETASVELSQEKVIATLSSYSKKIHFPSFVPKIFQALNTGA